jgi:SAM-dependent methyltransferase
MNLSKIIAGFRKKGLWGGLVAGAGTLSREIRRKLGFQVRLRTPDRILLEERILPCLAGIEGMRRVLFVGCDYYTSHYGSLFPGAEFITIEPRPTKAKYGGTRHFVGLMQEIDTLLEPGSVDGVVCNGVYGWGLDRRADIERAFNAAYLVLRPGGVFLLGWNDCDGRRPVPLESLESLARFERWNYPETGHCRLETGSESRHIFEFYRRPELPEGGSESP